MSEFDNKYASSGVGTAGLSLGIIGTALASLGSNGNGILGNLLGNGNSNQQMYVDSLQAKISELTSEKYADKVGVEVFKAAREQDAKLNTAVSAIKDELADIRVREARLDGKIDTVAMTAQSGISQVSSALACLQNTVSGITKVVVPNSNVCPGWGNVTITPATTTTAAA